VADVPLLKSLVGSGPETGHIRAGSLELRKRRDGMVIIKIVINAEILPVVQTMINAYRKLVITVGLYGGCYELIAAVSRSWNKLEQVNRSGIQTSKGDDVPGEEV
jgi:hypothetical protein